MKKSDLRLKYLYRVIDRRAGGDQPPLLAVSIHRGVVPRATITDDLPRAEDLSNYKLCEARDIVLNRMRAFQGAIGISPARGLVSPDYIVLRPEEEIEPRYLHHLFRSAWFVGEMTSRLRGIGGTNTGAVRTPRINPEDLGEIRVSIPSQQEQRRIAAFLDAEASRIDQLVSSRRRQMALLDERIDAVRDEVFNNPGPATRPTPLMHLTDPYRPIVYGIVQAGPETPGGIPYIKTGDLTNLHIDSLSRTSPEIHAQYKRAAVHPGDIVMAMRASIGTVSIIPPELREANLTQGTARIAPARSISGRWLFHTLQTRKVREQCDLRAVGSTFRTLNIWDLRRINIEAIPTSQQKEMAQRFDVHLTKYEELQNSTLRQMSLLNERRQALITAAVTGQFDVTSASGRGVTE